MEYMINSRPTILAIFMLLLPICVRAQVQGPLASVDLKIVPEHIKGGADAELQIYLTNNTKRRLIVQLCNQLAAEFNFTIVARGSDGHLAPKTRYFNAVDGKDPHLVIMTNYGMKAIEPGGTVRFTVELNKLFDLSQPDHYQITVEGREPETNNPLPLREATLVISAR
jgi:hypothetical protein